MIKQIIQAVQERLRLPLLTAIYGIAGGLAAVAFMESIHLLFDEGWGWLTALSPIRFAFGSLAVIVVSSLAAGILMSSIYPGAAGSGIPQLKTAYWNDMGIMSFRAVVVKFIGGVIALVGGASLGREGPTVYIAGGLASNLAGWMGIDPNKRRRAAVAGAAAGLAAAFNTPLAAISFVLEMDRKLLFAWSRHRAVSGL
jgi:CIC family chloride channel protein